MLGYVRVEKPELKVKELEMYGGYYCGVCKSIGKNHGQIPRMSLSYDAAFLATLIDGLDSGKIKFSREHCIIHPIKKKTIGRSKAIDYTTDVMLLLGYHKLEDDYLDEKKVGAKLGSLFFRNLYEKLSEKYVKLDEHFKGQLRRLHEMEENKERNIDKVADPFAKIMEEIVTYYFVENEEIEGDRNEGGDEPENVDGNAGENLGEGVEENAAGDVDGNAAGDAESSKFGRTPKSENVKSPLELETIKKVGYMLGKWIYIIDALDDFEEDLKEGRYNPFIYRLNVDKAEYENNSSYYRQQVAEIGERNLYLYGSDLTERLKELTFNKNEGIVENVIALGLLRRAEMVISEIKDPELKIKNEKEKRKIKRK